MLTLPAMNDAIMRTNEIIGHFKVQDGKRRERKKKGRGEKAQTRLSKAGGHLVVGLKGHQRHAGDSRLEENICVAFHLPVAICVQAITACRSAESTDFRET